MIALTPEAIAQIVVLITGLIVTIAGGVIYILKRQADTRLEKEKADNAFQGRVLSVLEGTLAQMAREREDAKHDTARFAAIMETNASSKNALTAAVTTNNDRLTTMATSIDKNTTVLKENTQTVGTHTERVGSVEQRLTVFETEIRLELKAIVDAVRKGLSDERMTPLIERVVQTTIDRVKEAPAAAEPPAPPALVPKDEPESEVVEEDRESA